MVPQRESKRAPREQESLRVKAMMAGIYRFFSRVRSSLAILAALARKLVGMQPREKEFTPQRMCPFCGLITARGKVNCLECGKSFKTA
jgi:hypothetical protein